MRKYIALIVLALLGLTSCEEDLLVYDTPDGFIQLSAETGTLRKIPQIRLRPRYCWGQDPMNRVSL